MGINKFFGSANLDAGSLSDALGFQSPIYLPYGLRYKFVANGFIKQEESEPATISDYGDIKIVSDEEADRLSMLGTPVFGSFWFDGGEYNVYSPRDGRLDKKTLDEFEFPVASLVTFSRDKNIIKTPTLGGYGTVKEVYGFNDWDIKVDGIIIPDPSRQAQKTVQEQMYAMQQFDEVAGSITIFRGKNFHNKNITRVTVESLTFNSVQGKPNVVTYSMRLSSDEDILLTGIQ